MLLLQIYKFSVEKQKNSTISIRFRGVYNLFARSPDSDRAKATGWRANEILFICKYIVKCLFLGVVTKRFRSFYFQRIVTVSPYCRNLCLHIFFVFSE